MTIRLLSIAFPTEYDVHSFVDALRIDSCSVSHQSTIPTRRRCTTVFVKDIGQWMLGVLRPRFRFITTGHCRSRIGQRLAQVAVASCNDRALCCWSATIKMKIRGSHDGIYGMFVLANKDTQHTWTRHAQASRRQCWETHEDVSLVLCKK